MSHSIHVFINKAKYELEQPRQTGASLKHLAGIALGDVLFLQQPGDDKVIANDATITLKNGDLDLTRFRGHLKVCFGGVHGGREVGPVHAGVQAADG